MNFWYFIAAPAWGVIIITATARLADLSPKDWALRYHFRRLGLAGIGTIAAISLAAPITPGHWLYHQTGADSAVLAWAWAIVWLTTENMPPWWDYILGVHRKTEEWAGMGWRARLQGEWRALRASFKPRRKRAPIVGPEGPLP